MIYLNNMRAMMFLIDSIFFYYLCKISKFIVWCYWFYINERRIIDDEIIVKYKLIKIDWKWDVGCFGVLGLDYRSIRIKCKF